MNVKMKVGTAQIDITPKPGIDLAGFAVRPQPSQSVLDPLYIRALYLENGAEQFLWLHADLLSLNQAWADRIRTRIHTAFGLPTVKVLVSTTHTHSGPATFHQNATGEIQPDYLNWLEDQFQNAAAAAQRHTESCVLVHAEGTCNLGLDRRKFASAHTDPRVGALGWQRPDGRFKAVFLNYAMHPVCLRDSAISADWPGAAAQFLSKNLPGEPMALVATGACGNINPPMVGVTPVQMTEWGETVAQSVLQKLLTAPPDELAQDIPPLKAFATTIDLPLENWRIPEIENYTTTVLAQPEGHNEFGEKFQFAARAWRASMIERCRHNEPFHTRAVLGVISLGNTTLLSLNAEVFSKFTELAAVGTGRSVYLIGCANGMIGYLPTSEAYDEGAYEVLWSMLFYNLPRPRQGGLEFLAGQARQLIQTELSTVSI